MTDYMAAMLNELMGPSRNALPGEAQGMDYDHPEVCRDFLVGFCFHDLFRNTKNDQGFCSKPNHDDNMKRRYKDSKRYCRLGYEEKFLDKARRYMNEVRRKINVNEERLRGTQGDAAASAALVKKREDLRDRREALTNRIQELVDEARSMGERGNVAAAREAVEKADECTKEKELLDKEEEVLNEEAIRNMAYVDNAIQGNRQMQVCQVCGCFMLVNDAQSRIDDHLSGKLHIAYLKIAEIIAEVETEKERIRATFDPPAEKNGDKEEEKSSEGKERRDKDKERGRDRRLDSKDRDRHKESKDRDRKKDSYRRSRSRDRHEKGSDDRRRDDRHRRDRDRKRSRSRDRHRR